MTFRRLLVVAVLAANAWAQQPPQSSPAPSNPPVQLNANTPAKPAPNRGPRWTVLIDPVCPVSSFYSTPYPNVTKEMRVLYFPAAEQAKLKDPQALTLQIAFNRPESRTSSVIPFSRNDDHWEAIVPLKSAAYAIFAVRDDKANVTDDNRGQFWDVVFCDAIGQKDLNGLHNQAQGYTGATWPLGLRRPQDYDKAIKTLEDVVVAFRPAAPPFLEDIWKYKVQRDGSDTAAWSKMAKELEKYLADHADNRQSANAVGNFITMHADKLPADFVEQTITALDARRNDPRYSLRARLEYNRAVFEKDPQKRLAAYDAFIAQHPEAMQVAFAHQGRFSTLLQLGDVAGATAAFAEYREALDKGLKNGLFPDANMHYHYLSLARLYIDKRVKLDEAFKLIEQAQQALKDNHAWRGPIPEQLQKSVDTQSAQLRARAYLALNKPQQALAEAQKSVALAKGPEAHFILAQALAATGDKQKALNEYFEAVLQPSNKDLEYGTALRDFYLKQHFGNAQKFDAELAKRKAAHFQAANYVPKLVERDAPTFEFTTITGEKFDPAALKGKTVVINFWSPG